MLLTIGKAGGIISKLSHKKQGQNALGKGMAIRVPPNCVGSLLVAESTMITEQYRPSLKFLKISRCDRFKTRTVKKRMISQAKA
jgi:hypothetical protein